MPLFRALLQLKFFFVKPGGLSNAFYLHRKVQLGIGQVEPQKSLTVPYLCTGQDSTSYRDENNFLRECNKMFNLINMGFMG